MNGNEFKTGRAQSTLLFSSCVKTHTTVHKAYDKYIIQNCRSSRFKHQLIFALLCFT